MNEQTLRPGFTIVELMAALVIAGILVSPLYLITRGMSDQTAAQRVETEAMQSARIAIQLLTNDFSRAGMFTTPNSQIDSRYLNRQVSSHNARHRQSVVHLNRMAGGPDIVMLSGSFEGSRQYEATFVSDYQVEIMRDTSAAGNQNNMNSSAQCLREFNPDYSFVQIEGSDGQFCEARVTNAQWTANNLCVVTLATSDLNDAWIADINAVDEHVYIAPNQTAVFWRNPMNHSIERYYVAYKNTSGTATCVGGTPNNIAALASVLPLDSMIGTSGIIESSRRIIARNVLDFQVWFRLVSREPTPANAAFPWDVPHQFRPSVNKYAYSLIPPDNVHVLAPPDDPDEMTFPNDISCQAATYDAQHVRSAVIRLSVRGEFPDESIDYNAFGTTAADYLARYNLAPVPAPAGDAGAAFAAGAAYKVKTLTTEVHMLNLTARSDLPLD